MNLKTVNEVSVDTIAKELKEKNQWVLWKPVNGDGKLKKVPVNKWGIPMNAGQQSNWMTFEEAREIQVKSSEYRGLGFALNGDFVVIDWDNCILDGCIEPQAEALIKHFQSYTEVSVSGKGIHIFVRGSLHISGRRNSQVECYHSKRFIAITGHVWNDFTCVENRQEVLDKWYLNAFPANSTSTNSHPIIKQKLGGLSDDDIIKKMFSSKIGNKIKALFYGDTAFCNDDLSRADYLLCLYISYYTKDENQINSIFRKSHLHRDKWDDKRGNETYGELTIRRAVDNQTKSFNKK